MTFGDENQKKPQALSDKLVSLNGLSFDLKGDRAKFVGQINKHMNHSFLQHLEDKIETGLPKENQINGPIVFADD